MLENLKRAVIGATLMSCGGRLADGIDGGDPLQADAGWTQCSSPDDQHICYGPSACTCPKDDYCDHPAAPDSGPGLGICTSELPESPCTPYNAADDRVCINMISAFPALFGTLAVPQPLTVGRLFAMNGAADRVRYEDMGTWTGESLPAPTTCPSMAVAQLCGPSCAPCPSDMNCFGRAPLHPWGVCMPTTGDPPNDDCNLHALTFCHLSGNKCFSYKVQADAQDIADQNSFCLPANLCDDMAQNLPGGGFCSP